MPIGVAHRQTRDRRRLALQSCSTLLVLEVEESVPRWSPTVGDDLDVTHFFRRGLSGTHTSCIWL